MFRTLLRVIKNKCNEEQLILVGVKAELIQHASEENKFKAGYKGIVQFFNERGFLAALEKLSSPDITAIEKLREMYTYSFQDEGWASPQSVRMSTLHSTDIINMMASRRATNRAKRLATGCGLTSIEEIGIDSAILERTVEPSQSISIEERIKRMRRQMFKDAKEIGLEPTKVQQEIKERFGKTSSKDLNEDELSEILQWLEKQRAESPKMQSDAIARDLINMMREAQDLEALKQIKRRARTALRKLGDEDKEEVDRMYWQRMKELKQDQEIIEEGDDDE